MTDASSDNSLAQTPSGAARINGIFASLRERGGKALMPYVTAGDPDIAATGALLPAMQRAGASICELGIAFSDPIADGPTIQASMTYALDRGVRPADVLAMVAEQRAALDADATAGDATDGRGMGLIAMLSYSIVHRLGAQAFVRDAKQAGIDGFIFPDLPVEESALAQEVVANEAMTLSFLIAPNTPAERAERIAKACTGFVYVLSRAGVTGARSELPADLSDRLRRLGEVTDLPLAVGFGVSDASQVRSVVEVADAAIVGSAIMSRVAKLRGELLGSGEASDRGLTDDQRGTLVADLEAFVGDLASGLSTE